MSVTDRQKDDLTYGRHLDRQLIENYDFMVQTDSHERALLRLGLTQKEWDNIMTTAGRRKKRTS